MKNIISLETIKKDTLWVAKMYGWRAVGTYDEVGHYAKEEECRDFDLCCAQPEHLEEFYELFFAYEEEHGFTFLDDFYPIYVEEMAKREEEEDDDYDDSFDEIGYNPYMGCCDYDC